MSNDIELIEKPCKDCGKVELMAPSCERCLDCRVKRMDIQSKEYNEKKKEEIRKKALERYYKKKRVAKERKEYDRSEEIKKIFPVQYIEKNGKYMWHVRQFNPVTNRFFIWESEKEFDTLLEAQQDYCSATR